MAKQLSPSDRGNGFGKAAMIAAEKIALENKFSMLSLNVFDTNIIAKAMYLSLDYHVIESKDGKSEMQKKL
jgi:ribosomal protein S18 acetylase RimI-like enzyme